MQSGNRHRSQVCRLRNAGINRISIGLQSAVDEELKILGRIHTFDQFLKTYELARKNGFDNVNVDIMSSLPGQTAESFARTLQQLLWLKPEHISAYSLIIEKGTPFYDLYKFDAVKQQAGMQTVALPTEDEVYRMTKLTEQVLAEAGYVHYEVSNFAKPGYGVPAQYRLLGAGELSGLGLGASSLMENIRYSNTRELYVYLEETRHIREGIWENEITDSQGRRRIRQGGTASGHESACFGRAHYTKRADGRVYVFRTPHDGGNFQGTFCTDVWNTD